MKELLNENVTPADDDETPLSYEEIDRYHTVLNHDWKCIHRHHLIKTFNFDDFMSALDFVNQVGQYAESVNHHPEITFTWGEATISIYTHDVDGLRKDDFVWAANVEEIYQTSLSSED